MNLKKYGKKKYESMMVNESKYQTTEPCIQSFVNYEIDKPNELHELHENLFLLTLD